MEKGIHRIAVGIGPKIRPKQLRQIAGPHNEDGVVSVTDFIELSRKIRRLREVTCSECQFFTVTFGCC